MWRTKMSLIRRESTMWSGLSIFILLFVHYTYADQTSETKEGLCAPPTRLFITGAIQKCSSDIECPSDLKCCQSKSRTKVCAPPQPALTACQYQKAVAVEIARSIDASTNFSPDCEDFNGTFAPIQCNEAKQRCWCVDQAGFEIAGTRAPLGVAINCSAPRICPNPECRMLCPQAFKIMKNGCPVCECFDACDDIKCPRSTKCVTEEVACVNEPCPPVSRCAARAIDEVDCPTGLPALVDINKKDYFLCSLLPNIKASKCPSGFHCNVREGKEFGVCCPKALENVLKPGQCPLNTTSEAKCVQECQVDQECYGEAKCCSDGCSARCLSPVAVTSCQTHRMTAAGIPGVFLPTCDAKGHFATVQCYGTKCWCVDPLTGSEQNGTRTTNGALPNCAAPKQCANVQCDLQCEQGLKTDVDGCPICACYDACEELSCPDGCNLLDYDCGLPTCPPIATCKESRSLNHPCIYGSPARVNGTGDYLLCGDTMPSGVCPDRTKCEPMDAEGHGLCCPVAGSAEPRLKELKVPKTSKTEKKEVIMIEQNGKLTACQASAAHWSQLASSQNVFVPQCDEKGNYLEKQCLNRVCWCVDNIGEEVSGTRTSATRVLDCKNPTECAPQCRMFCPFGFVRDENGCSQCDCAPSPCNRMTCEAGSDCQLEKLDCVKEPCPIVPKCVTSVKVEAVNPCAFGLPLTESETNVTVVCSEDVESALCPVTHVCTRDERTKKGVCCQRQSIDVCHLPKDTGPCRAAFPRWHFNKETGACQQFTWGGCEGNLNNFVSQKICDEMCTGPSPVKLGHCPVPTLEEHATCAQECTADGDCPGLSAKCCSNGCGSVCSPAAFQSACDMQNTAMGRLVSFRKASMVQKLYVPQCNPDGSFKTQQCNDVLMTNASAQECWCVKEDGQEIDGSRRLAGKALDCSTIRADLCQDALMCRMDCGSAGFKHDPADGCSICDCEDPCEFFECTAGRECKLLEVGSITNVTSRVPVCAPKPSPALTCPFGEPIRTADTNQIRVCFDNSSCPSNHSCETPAGCQAGICCSKMPSVCQLLPEVGPCRGTIPRFHFDPTTQTCKTFLYGGCQGNGNNFPTSEECTKVCLTPSTILTEPIVPPVPQPVPLPVDTRSATSPRPPVNLCLTGNSLPPFVGAQSDNSTEACSENLSCPLTHKCFSGEGETACCAKTSDDCFLPVISGQCKATIPRFHFDPKTKSCQKFVYSGCDANANNFATEDQCRALCPVMTECEALRRAALYLQVNSSTPVFVPECDEFDGSWIPVQCQPALGMCWCVDANGKADMTTAVRGYPMCGESVIASNASAEVCQAEDGPMSFCDPQTCRRQVCYGHPRAQCKVNPCGGCAIGFYNSENEKVDCNEGLTECQNEFQSTISSAAWAKIQIAPPLFAPGTKSSPNGNDIAKISVFVNGTSKLGMCPPYFSLPHEGCSVDCHDDSQCAEDKKCCFAGCGYTCVSPIPIATAKPGQCPANTLQLDRSGEEKCELACNDDTECQGEKKCCSRGKCSLACVDAVVEPVLMPLYMPTCGISGDYEWTQCTGELCWCVNATGGVREETVTRGQIQCNASGIVVGKVRLVCADGKKPHVCRDTCRAATCTARPDAFCNADPCKECSVRFVDRQGKTVDCHDACSQRTEEGTCSSAASSEVSPSVRYSFNTYMQECRPFNYSGCGGNENNFQTTAECLTRCLPKDICMQEMSTGPCRALIDRWGFNKKTGQCEQFDYGGCQGNGNNFETKAACEKRCPEITVCPKLSATATVSTCNRTGLCQKAKCAHPLAECRVEPCSCKAEFVDKWGRVLPCEALPTKCQVESLERSVMADIYHPQCAANGSYMPMQCFADHFSEKCWCVDENGNALESDVKFARNERQCLPVAIDSVRLFMRFNAPPEMSEKEMKQVLTAALDQIDTRENAVESLSVLPAKHNVVVNVVLKGQRAADIAYLFEKKLNQTRFKNDLSLLELRSDYVHADQHLNVAVDDAPFIPARTNFNETLTGNAVVPSNGQNLLPLLALLAVFIVFIVLVGVFLYRRRKTGSYTNRQSSGTSTPDLVEKQPPSSPQGAGKALPNDYSSVSSASTVTKPAIVEHIYETPQERLVY